MAPEIRLGIEELEQRIAPALLTVRPVAGPNEGMVIASADVDAHAEAANVNVAGVHVEP
jgi:hypothetical protein